MKRIFNLQSTQGGTYVTVCVLILVIMMIFSAVFTYASVITEVKVQKTNTKIVFDSFVANNSILIYQNIKQGNNAVEHLDTSSFYTAFENFCTLENRGGTLYNYDDDGNVKYSLSMPAISFAQTDRLSLIVGYTMYVPIRFAGKTVTTARIPITIKSELQTKN